MNEIIKSHGAVTALAERLQLDPQKIKAILISTVFPSIKKSDGSGYRQATDDEFLALCVVANAYNLNPMTKEIYAYPDEKRGAIIPVVSTDGWTRLMVDHPKYKTHQFRYSEKLVTMNGGKPCPEWCEIDIERADGSHVIVREYLDEVFREVSYKSPWQTHTKRMLRHKTKIQGGREAFGFGGIYDEDEAARIVEAAEFTEIKPERKQISQPREVQSEPVEQAEAAPQDTPPGDFQAELDQAQGATAPPPAAAGQWMTVSQVLASTKTVFDIKGHIVKTNTTGAGDKVKTWYTLCDDTGEELDISAFGSRFDGAVPDAQITIVAVEKKPYNGKTYYNAKKENMVVVA